MANAQGFREDLKNGLSGIVSHIITYKSTIGADASGRVFIVESGTEEPDEFYTEEKIDEFREVHTLSIANTNNHAG